MYKERRDKILLLQKKQDELLKDKMDEYETLDSHIAKVLGAHKTEIINQR